MKVRRIPVAGRPHVVIPIEDGTGDQWIGPHLAGAVVKFEVTAEGAPDLVALRQQALDAGAVHVHPIVARRPAAAPSGYIITTGVPTDPAQALSDYAETDPPPANCDPVALLSELL